MKVKQQPEDFRVEEVSRLEAGPEGAFALYRLEKRGIGTPEAVKAVARAWRVPARDLSFAGLKDRYGVTGQMVSVRRGRHENLAGPGFKLNYLGRSDRPAHRGTIERNHFRIRLRDLAEGEAARVRDRALAAADRGIPNYFDDQRFGSLRGTDGKFVARFLIRGDFEGALRLAIASPDKADRSRLRKRRSLLKKRWGHWPTLVAQLDPSTERRICERLAAGGSFEEAYRLVDRPLRDLHLSSFQAHLFNKGLRDAVADGSRVEHQGVDGPYRFYKESPGDLDGESIPLASGDAPRHPLLDRVLDAEFLDRAELAQVGFRAGARPAIVRPEELEVSAPEPDELNVGRIALVLSFALRPGAYATMLIKRCTHDLKA